VFVFDWLDEKPPAEEDFDEKWPESLGEVSADPDHV
jgi:hypothetical protein